MSKEPSANFKWTLNLERSPACYFGDHWWFYRLQLRKMIPLFRIQLEMMEIFCSSTFQLSVLKINYTKLQNLSLVPKDTTSTLVSTLSTIIWCIWNNIHEAYSNPATICLDCRVFIVYLVKFVTPNFDEKRSIRAVWSLPSQLYLWIIFVAPVLFW